MLYMYLYTVFPNGIFGRVICNTLDQNHEIHQIKFILKVYANQELAYFPLFKCFVQLIVNDGTTVSHCISLD